jgi:WhiB family redox-sensing transcriptional regulator
MSFTATSWQRSAACVGADLDLFFPELPGEAEEAKRICAGCPVKPECLRHAVNSPEHGIWAGTDEDERRGLRRNMLRSQRARVAA